VPPLFIQETDGSIGAISVVQGFDRFCAANSVIMAEKEALPILRSVAYAVGLNVVKPQDIKKGKHAIVLLEFSTAKGRAEERAKQIVEEYAPAVIISVEKAGANKAKAYHNMKGYDISGHAARVESLFEEARKREIPSIGIGDSGNEIGMGKTFYILQN
jgi:hypothetical protein